MDIILIPGLWLDGDSWGAVVPPLEAAGHTVHPLTLPGMESLAAERASIGLRDHVNAVIDRVDALGGPVVLVGHSGGGAIIHAVVDARPDSITRAIYVDSQPIGHGGLINDELPTVGGEIPLPDWSVFEEPDLVDLTDDLREHFRQIAIPSPKGVAFDRQVLGDERRYDVPITVICCEFHPDQLRGWIDAGYADELKAIKRVDTVYLPTGHWPQFTKPSELAEAILDALKS